MCGGMAGESFSYRATATFQGDGHERIRSRARTLDDALGFCERFNRKLGQDSRTTMRNALRPLLRTMTLARADWKSQYGRLSGRSPPSHADPAAAERLQDGRLKARRQSARNAA